MEERERFAHRLYSERTEQRLSMAELARRVGMSTAAVSLYERCMRSPQLSVVEKYAEALHVSPAWLAGRSDRKEEGT